MYALEGEGTHAEDMNIMPRVHAIVFFLRNRGYSEIL